MAVQLTGTPIGITWEQVQEPTPQSITIPVDCVAVCMFWRYYSANASGLASATLNGNAHRHSLFQIHSLKRYRIMDIKGYKFIPRGIRNC